MKNLKIYLVLIMLAAGGSVSAQLSDAVTPAQNAPEAKDESQTAPDENDTEIRINPEIGAPGANTVVNPDKYPFINREANHIKLNGADWSALVDKFDAVADGGTVSIVHIGDSHIQPDGNTGRVRKLLQAAYGSAGRGLMTPFRLAGTNQPLDYKITTPGSVISSSLMRMPWATNMGFTGISIQPQLSHSQFSISSPQPFTILNIYASQSPDLTDVSSNGAEIKHTYEKTGFGGVIHLERPVADLTVKLHSPDMALYGFDARNGKSGILYHSIGNNGATYSTYSLVGAFGRQLRPLTPDLVILAMGTNEAFGRTSDATFRAQIDRMVRDIKQANPDTQILLVTPSECQRSVYKRRRRRRRAIRTYQVNANVARMRDVILKYGAENNIPVYDFYKVAGGQGASTKWLQNKLLSADRIHRTWAGYYLEGELLHDALISTLMAQGINEPPHHIATSEVAKPASVSAGAKAVSKSKAKNVRKKKATKRKKSKRRRSRR